MKVKLFLLGALFSCVVNTLSAQGNDPKLSSDHLESPKVLPVLFHQYSAEYRALCYQAFNIAAMRLDKFKKKRKDHVAIITDVDETILDNTKYEAQRIIEGTEYSSASWHAWTDKSEATIIPGAAEFLQLAKQKEIEIFYLSNRDTLEIVSTIANLQKFKLPDADAEHMLFKRQESSKEQRRKNIIEKYNVVMLVGDNLNDFTDFFEKKSNVDRSLGVDKMKGEWGKRFIVLPNVTYGEWENALYNYQRNLTPEQKQAILRGLLIGE